MNSKNRVATLCARVVLKPYAIYRAQLTAFKAVDGTIYGQCCILDCKATPKALISEVVMSL